MDLDRLDLNLLRIFEALMAERHITRAAARLGLTQSAASNALGRLRAAFEDDLFQRTPTGMEPTALARELAGPVGAALDAVRAAVALNRPFDPAHAEESFTLGMSDYAEFVLAPPLIAALRARAPGVSVVVRHVDREVVTALLDDDRATSRSPPLGTLGRWLEHLREPSASWVRVPLGVLLVLGGLLGFLPVLGFRMVPLGLVLLALDIALRRRPTARMLVGGERLWGRFRRARQAR
jgi:Bacterial regulatory helix-turn-helix protein, lysR family